MYYPILNFVFDENNLLSSSVLIKDSYSNKEIFELTIMDNTINTSIFFNWFDILLDQYTDGYEQGIIDATDIDKE
nr:MAG TPA: hypothetical protein [Caudoviricetes sp.]